MSRDCDVLHRYRSSCHAKRDAPECALVDARRAAALNRGSAGHWRVARVLEQRAEHTAAGGAYLAAMRRGMPAATGEVGEVRFANLLDAVRRTRSYANMVRPLSRECVHQHGLGASKSLGGLGMVRRPSRVGRAGAGGAGFGIGVGVGIGSRGRGRDGDGGGDGARLSPRLRLTRCNAARTRASGTRAGSPCHVGMQPTGWLLPTMHRVHALKA